MSSPRLLAALAMILAATPPLIATQLARPASHRAEAIERAGLTLGEGRDRHVVVTSLRNGGPADRVGMAVGDELRAIDGRHITGAAMARGLMDGRARCAIRVDLRRATVPHVARFRQCR